ncbi:unnamed protein product [Durusdinium trenchii]|uniref:Pentatricopeptide repeat-containing protein, chloroplastic n=1 Tax=Durusdinium trenchii TaxID=1381693 RepID=A0ABP0SWQ9_9DINO
MAFGFFARRRSFLWPRPGTFRGLAAASINLKAFLEGPCRSQWLLVNEPGEGPLAERTAQEVRKSLHGLEVSALAVVDLAPHSGAANFEVLLERFQVALTQAAVEEIQRADWRTALQLFEDGASLRLDAFVYGVLANVCAKSSQWQQALLCLHHMLHQSLQSDTVVFNAAISSCEKAQQWPNALALLQLMSEMRYEADLISQNAALAALGSAGEWLQALQQFEDLPSVHLEGNDVTYSSTMNAVARVGLWRTAEQLWSNLEVQNLEQSVVACNVAITACERGNQWTEALGFLQKIWENSLEPTVVTVGACTSACEASWRTALALPFDMNIVALNAVISACGKDGQWDIALHVFRSVKTLQLEPTLVTYNAALDACEKRALWELALLILDEAIRIFPPNVITCSAVISACEKGQAWPVALQLFLDMSKLLLKPNVITYGSMISAYGRAEQWDSALDLLHALQTRELRPNHAAYDIAVTACEQGQQWQPAFNLLGSLQAAELEADAMPFITAARATARPWPSGVALLSLLRGRGVQCQAGVGDDWPVSLAMLSERQLRPDAVILRSFAWPKALQLAEAILDRSVFLRTMLPMCEDGLQWRGVLSSLVSNTFELRSGCSSLMRTCESWLQSLNLLQTARIWRARSTVLLYSAAMNTCEEPATPTERLSEVSQDRPSQLWRVATALLMDMQQAEVLPNLITIGALVGVYGGSSQLQRGVELFQQTSADLVLYNILISACRENSKTEEAGLARVAREFTAALRHQLQPPDRLLRVEECPAGP